MKIKYRRSTPTGYSTRAARAEAKKIVLARLAEVIRDSAICGYEQTIIDAEKVAEKTSGWPSPWREGVRKQLDKAAMELLDEFERRSSR